jgi:hypothetical protein
MQGVIKKKVPYTRPGGVGSFTWKKIKKIRQKEFSILNNRLKKLHEKVVWVGILIDYYKEFKKNIIKNWAQPTLTYTQKINC